MYTINFWHKFHIHWRKVILLPFILLYLSNLFAQNPNSEINNPNYDERKFISYGFSIGIHASGFQIKHSNAFVTSALDTVHSIMPTRSPGFSLGFIVNLRAADLLDIRLLPRVSFYEYELDYNFINGETQSEFVELTMVEFPFVIKYKSVRRKNLRVYLVGGVVPSFDASGKNDLEDPSQGLNIKNGNVSLEVGAGLDIYYPLFKFSPEIRYSRGLINVLSDQKNDFSKGL